ncbi:MAG: SPASM domain-containing protein [Alphaproteobacteria bacterium]|nr:SPASM domain-containing protein [Alphaproteobacteria bacterium]
MAALIDLETQDRYSDGIRRMRASPYLDYPAHVHMETLAVCNAACDFCPYPVLERQGAKMPDDLIEKILRDLAEIPRSVPFQISPFKVNEPFVDTRLFDITRAINRRLPNASIALTSNASPMTDAVLEKLLQIRKVAYLAISFNDHREAEYEATMKLPYRRTLARLEALHALVQAGRTRFPVVLSRVGDGSQADQAFVAWVEDRFPGFRGSVSPRGDWLGQVETQVTGVPAIPCQRWFELSITATGVVAHCCMDGMAKFPIGDVRERSILEIYNDPTYRVLREKTATRLEVSPCKGCTFM